MRDLVTRLILDNSDFDRNIHSSRNELEQFRNIGSSVTNVLGKFAGGITAAVGVTELFTTAVNSNRDSQTKFNSVMGGAKLSVDRFFTSLNTGDWSFFRQGLRDTINDAIELSAELQSLELSAGLGKSKAERFEALKNNYEWMITSDNLNITQKKEGYNKYIAYAKQEIAAREETNEGIMSPLMKELQQLGITTIKNAKDYQKAIEQFGSTFTQDYKNLMGYKAIVEPLDEKIDYYKGALNSPMTHEKRKEIQKKYNEAKAKRDAVTDPFLDDMLKLYPILTEGKIKEVKPFLDEVNENIDKIGTIRKDVDAANADIKKAIIEQNNKKVTTSPTSIKSIEAESAPKFEQFTLGYYEEIADAQRKIRDEQSKTNEEYDKANEHLKITQSIIDYIKSGEGIGEYFMLQHELKARPELAELNEKTSGKDDPIMIDYDKLNKAEQEWVERLERFYLKNNLKDENGNPSIDKFDNYFNQYFSGDKSSVVEVEATFASGSLNELRAQRQALIEQLNNATSDEERIEIQAKITANQKKEAKMLNPTSDGNKAWSDKIAKANEYSQAIQAVSASIQALNATKFDNNTEGWIQWTTSVVSQAASVIAAYYSIAMAAGTANAFKMPWPANLAVWGSISAAIISAFASLPAFENGGIIEGNSEHGDKLLARVNSGEMILNKSQQKNLYRQLNTAVPTSSVKGSGNLVNTVFNNIGYTTNGKVEFKIQGKELIGVLNNYNKRNSKL